MTALLYVQPDGTLLVQSQHPSFAAARPTLAAFAELVQRMDPLHVYRIRPITLWQAAAVAISARDILSFLRVHAAHPLPYALQQTIVEETGKWGQLTLQQGSAGHVVLRGERAVLRIIGQDADVRRMAARVQPEGIAVPLALRGELKRRLLALGHPVVDMAGYQLADAVHFRMLQGTVLREYQRHAVAAFVGTSREESGVVVLPCGAGKTLVGVAIAAALGLHTLVLAPNESAATQWEAEFRRFTDVQPEHVARYDSPASVAPITITTYQRVTAKTRAGERRHLEALTRHAWGLVIYDEVHMLPAPLFRLAADLQGVRRLGLTATLVREDGADGDVFSLIGPKRFEVSWKSLEHAGYLAEVECVQVRVPLSAADRTRYADSTARDRHRIAALNPIKLAVAARLAAQHRGKGVLVLGHYLDSLGQLAKMLGCPLITGQTPQSERDDWFERFRHGEVTLLALSRIANMAIDLPTASIAIQLSGLFGSRQEEAQRLGRLLRPAGGSGVFYTLVSGGTIEERMSLHRQLYLTEQGYTYRIEHAAEPAVELAGIQKGD